MSFINPYFSENVPWLRGNLHAHTTNSDGARAPQKVVDAYASAGYDVLAISDHDYVTDLTALDARGMILLSANEVTANGPHILHVGATERLEPHGDRRRVLQAIQSSPGFAVVNHPNWERDFAHCPQAELAGWDGYTGIEIYNGVVRRLEGNPVATDRWDQLLSAGRRVWGFAHDDSHRPGDDAIAWLMVQSADRTADAVIAAMEAGRFYCSTGVTIERIHVDGRSVRLDTANAQRIVVHSDFGHREMAADASSMSFTLPEDSMATYVRVECWGPGEAMAWTQPFFVARG